MAAVVRSEPPPRSIYVSHTSTRTLRAGAAVTQETLLPERPSDVGPICQTFSHLTCPEIGLSNDYSHRIVCTWNLVHRGRRRRPLSLAEISHHTAPVGLLQYLLGPTTRSCPSDPRMVPNGVRIGCGIKRTSQRRPYNPTSWEALCMARQIHTPALIVPVVCRASNGHRPGVLQLQLTRIFRK